MLKEVQNQIYSNLQRGNPCTINHFIEKFSCFKAIDILEIFVNTYKHDRNQNFDLLCHIVVSNDEQVRIQLERYSNIQKGVMIQDSNHFTTHNFKKEHIKQLKILAIFPKQLLISEVQTLLQMPVVAKTKEYFNKFVLVPKLSVQNTNLVKNKVKKQEKKQQKPLEIIKNQQPIVEQKKFIKKTQSKSSMQIQHKPAPSIAPLKKVSPKEQPVVTPQVLTSYAAQRKKVEQQVEIKPPQSKKLNLDSDEQYYNANPNVFNQQLKTKIEQSQETDHSAIKAEPQSEKMEIQAQNLQNKKDINKFIVDDSDEEDDFVKQIAAQRKKETQSERQSSSTQPKKQNSITPMAIKPKIEAPKVVPLVKKQNASVTSKPPPSLKNWLVAKKV